MIIRAQRRWKRVLGVTLLGVIFGAGSVIQRVDPLPPTVLSDGRHIEDLVAGDSAVVVVYDPANCFRCDALLPLWLEWRRLHPTRLALVLTRQPGPDERAKLAQLGLDIEGIVQPPRLRWLTGIRYAPSAFLIVNGKAVAHEPAGLIPENRPIQRYVINDLELRLELRATGAKEDASASRGPVPTVEQRNP